MKRRAFVLASTLVPALGRAAVPCPPPQVSVSGGGTAATNCQITSGNYSTSFAGTENPISEGGKWVNGKQNGMAWQNVATANGMAIATHFMYTAPPYDDCIAHLSPSFITFNPNQWVEGVVYRNGTYTGGGHEIELLTRFLITANNARGYEAYWNIAANDIYIVRWNGPLNNFTPLAVGHVTSNTVTGHVVRMEVTGTNPVVIVVKVNGVTIVTASDSSASRWTSGQPGLGQNPYGTVSNFTDWAFQDWSAGNI